MWVWAAMIAAASAGDSPLVPDGEADRMGKHPVEAGSLVFKPGKGLVVASADDAFELDLGMRLQFRHELSDDSGTWEQAFLIRRARVNLGGHFYGKDNTYKIQLAFSSQDEKVSNGTVTRTPLLDAYYTSKHLRDLNLQVGQLKVPYTFEQIMSSGALDLVDRSITHSEFSLERDIGLVARSDELFGAEQLTYDLGVFMGEGQGNTASADFGMLYVARVTVKPMGAFDMKSVPDMARDPDPHLAVGGAFAVLQHATHNEGIAGSVPADGGTTDFLMATGDVLFHAAGFSVLGAVEWRQGTRTAGDAVDELGVAIPVEAPRDGLGWFVQPGWLIPHAPVGVAARFSDVRGSSGSSLGQEDEVAGGVSWYAARHNLKLQADYVGVWADGDTSTLAHEVRSQLQIAY